MPHERSATKNKKSHPVDRPSTLTTCTTTEEMIDNTTDCLKDISYCAAKLANDVNEKMTRVCLKEYAVFEKKMELLSDVSDFCTNVNSLNCVWKSLKEDLIKESCNGGLLQKKSGPPYSDSDTETEVPPKKRQKKSGPPKKPSPTTQTV